MADGMNTKVCLRNDSGQSAASKEELTYLGSCFFLYEDPPADRTSDALSTRSPDNIVALTTQGAAGKVA